MGNLFDKQLIDTGLQRKMTINGHTEIYKIYKVNLNDLYYNDQNDRIATWISKYKADNNIENINLTNYEEYNKLISSFIIKSNERAFKQTKNNIKLFGQQEPAVVLKDGRVIDGNRRFTCLRELAKENPKFGYIDVIILEKSIENNKKEIKLLELYLQHGREERVDYNSVDKLVGMYNDIKRNKLVTIQEYSMHSGIEEREIKISLEIADLMNDFLEFIKMPEQYYIARDLELATPLDEARKVIKRVDSDEEKTDLKNIIFNFIIMRPEGDVSRYLRKIPAIINSKYYQEFVESQLELVETNQEKIEDEDIVTLDFLNEEIKSDYELKESILDNYEKYQERLKKTQTLNAPKNQLEKAMEAINSIDTFIITNLSDNEYHKFISTLEELESTIRDFKIEVLGDVKSNS
ncbi:ParB/RepB/Spo0J family partition protein [Macrococcus bovicus]|uniref:ParB/RepB/Spo0J family partition protein n=1 Tax=Macrococcus bovicus TaxID=69968 RepID=UPI0025A6410A|nr:ParB/RepB/Spo0J family partition protein [Macrococcus bovicus]WJP97397.1 ParB/RepB/Spo0J family partition protein [Macrococcus bovicus]